MRYDALRYFVEIAEQGSINRAAEALYVSQPNLSTAIRSLEEELGVKLLERTSKGVRLTEEGQSVYVRAKKAFGELKCLELDRRLRDYACPLTLSVSLHGLFLSEDVLGRFCRETECDGRVLCIEEAGAEQALGDVAASRTDLGALVMNDWQLPAFKRIAAVRSLTYECVGESPPRILVGCHSPLYRQEKTTAEQLAGYPQLLLPDDYFSALDGRYRAGSPRRPQGFPRSIVVNSGQGMVRLLKSSDAFLYANKWAAADLRAGGIRALTLAGDDTRQRLLLVTRQRETLSPPAELFRRLFCEHYRAL